MAHTKYQARKKEYVDFPSVAAALLRGFIATRLRVCRPTSPLPIGCAQRTGYSACSLHNSVPSQASTTLRLYETSLRPDVFR